MAKRHAAATRGGQRQPEAPATPAIPVITAENMPPLMKVTLMVPVSQEDKVIRLCEQMYQETGVKIYLRLDEMDSVQGTMLANDGEGAPARVARATAADRSERRGTPTPENAEVREARVGGRAAVVYQVIDRSVELGGVKGIVHTFLMARGNKSAREVIAGTGLGQKSVESAIHTLRTDGVIRSVPIEG